MPTTVPYAGPLTFPHGTFFRSLPFPAVPFSTAIPPKFLVSGFGPLFAYDSSMPSGIVGVAYSQTLTAGGGTSPYTFAVVSGSLPPGLSLSSAGVISGTPTTPGTYVFGIGVTDARPAATSQSFAVTVLTAAVITLTNSGYTG